MKMKNNTREREKSTIRKITKEKKNFYSKEEGNNSSEISDDEVPFLGIEESNEIEKIEHKDE